MSNRSGSSYSVPREANHVPFLVAASTADGQTPVVLEADPTSHALQVYGGTISAVINVGQTVSNTSAVQLSAISTVPTNGIIVQALKANTAEVYIGGSGVTTSTGFELQPGQAISFSCNLNTLYVIGSNNTDKVCWNVE